jgi:acyl-CoA dehydrogenase
LTPIAKLTTARQAVSVASECLEAFGGAGYVEDTGIPALLRDAQVLTIWEGTTNVLALDTLRALDHGGLEAVREEVGGAVDGLPEGRLLACGLAAQAAVERAERWLDHFAAEQDVLQAGARRLALTLGRALEVALLVKHASWEASERGEARTIALAERLAREGIDRIHDGETGG